MLTWAEFTLLSSQLNRNLQLALSQHLGELGCWLKEVCTWIDKVAKFEYREDLWDQYVRDINEVLRYLQVSMGVTASADFDTFSYNDLSEDTLSEFGRLLRWANQCMNTRILFDVWSMVFLHQKVGQLGLDLDALEEEQLLSDAFPVILGFPPVKSGGYRESGRPVLSSSE